MQSRQLDIIRKEILGKYPSAIEIAIIAAILSIASPASKRPKQFLSDAAITLLEECKEMRDQRIDFLTLREFVKKQDAFVKPIFRPKKFPVSLDEFLKRALPKKRVEDRMKLYRESIRASIQTQRTHEKYGPVQTLGGAELTPSDEEVGKIISEHRASGFNEFQYYPCLVALRSFSEVKRTMNLKIRGMAGAAGRKMKREQYA